MKKLFVILCVFTLAISCKNDTKKDVVNEEPELVETNEKTVNGNFMYYEDAAVFQTRSELFGVIENEKLQELILQSETLKNEPMDEVLVSLKVKTSKKPENEEGWDNRIEILEIIKVSKANPDQNTIIKLGKEKNAENQ